MSIQDAINTITDVYKLFMPKGNTYKLFTVFREYETGYKLYNKKHRLMSKSTFYRKVKDRSFTLSELKIISDLANRVL